MLPQLIHKEPVKFVGDLNPESVLTDLTQRTKDSPRYSRIGIWVEQSRLEQEQFRRQQEAAARHGNVNGAEAADAAAKKQAAVQRYSKVERGRRTLTGHQKNYLQAVGALRVLPKTTQDALVMTFVSCIDPLFPIIDCKKLLQEYKDGEASVFLVQAICMVACKTEEARPHLRLHEDGQVMDPIPFARALHTGLDAAMKADLEADRFTKVQILTLMSLHNDGPGGIEESSLHLVMAIHDAQTTGLHINTPGRTRNDQQAMLWWTLWTLDKFNACLGGRPLMISDRDIDIERPVLDDTQRSQIIAVWLAMGDLLDDVIEYYRPRTDPDTAGWEGHFPSFEELTKDVNISILSEHQQNLLEVAYNIIGILSCRAGGPTSRSYQRRIVSADRIQKLTAKGRHAELPPVPLVPYAVSLSLTVAYRGLRDSYCDPVKAQSDLAARCDILESFHKTWWTADAMAKLGRKALKSLQQQSEDARKSSVGIDIGDSLEAEVAVCKYGPFDQNDAQRIGQQRPSQVASVANGASKSRDSVRKSSNGLSADRLQVLSQAAAQFGAPNGKRRANMNFADLNISDPGTTAIRNTSATAPHPSKRPRYDSDMRSPSDSSIQMNNLGGSDSRMDLSTPPSTAQLPTLSNTPALTPMDNPTLANILDAQAGRKMMTTPNTGVFEINPLIDPFCATTDLNPETSTDPQVMNAANLSSVSIPANMTAPSTVAHHPQLYNPRLSVPLHYQTHKDLGGAIDIELYNYNDLDNLFDGFFDLSMPTMFEDPLFEGSSFDQFSFNYFPGGGLGSGGPSGAGSIDMNYMQQQAHNSQQQNAQGNPNMGGRVWQASNAGLNLNEVSFKWFSTDSRSFFVRVQYLTFQINLT